MVCTLSDDYNTVALKFGSLDDALVDAMLAVNLKRNLGHDANVDITAGQTCVHSEHPVVTAHQTHDPDSEFGCFGLDVGRSDERN